MELKHTIETKVTVDYSDLDRFITNYFSFPREKTFFDKHRPEPEDGIYKVEFEFVAIEEASNDSSYTFSVDGELDDWDKEGMRKILEKKTFPNYCTSEILNYLASEDAIPKGNYLVTVCW